MWLLRIDGNLGVAADGRIAKKETSVLLTKAPSPKTYGKYWERLHKSRLQACLESQSSDAERTLLDAQGVSHLGHLLEDFADTAAVLETCDQVIAVDTSVAHLAGALGKPVWILLPARADWR